MKDLYENIEEWVEEFSPLMEFDEDLREEMGQELFFDASESEDMESMAKEMIELYRDGTTKLYQHVWTRVDGESGRLILLNGWHICNRLDYVLCTEPWGSGKESDSEVYIEVRYEEKSKDEQE